MKVSLYNPDVECVSDPKYDDEAACSNLIGTLPAAPISYLFTHDTESPGYKVITPWKESGMRYRMTKPVHFWHVWY